MKYLLVSIVCFSFSGMVKAQQGENSKKLDSISTVVIHYMQQKQADSVYALTGAAFRDKITPENFNSICTSQLFPLNDFSKVTFANNIRGINKYKVEGKPTLQLLVGIDTDNKIETLLIQPWVDGQ